MNALSINIKTIKRIMNQTENYSNSIPGSPYTIDYTVAGHTLEVLARPHSSYDDCDVTYYFDDVKFDSYDEMFEAVAQHFLETYY